MFNWQYEKEYDKALSSLKLVWEEYRSKVNTSAQNEILNDTRVELEEKLNTARKQYHNTSKNFFGESYKTTASSLFSCQKGTSALAWAEWAWGGKPAIYRAITGSSCGKAA